MVFSKEAKICASFGIRIVNFPCIQSNVHILITQIFYRLEKSQTITKLQQFEKLASLKGHPVPAKFKRTPCISQVYKDTLYKPSL